MSNSEIEKLMIYQNSLEDENIVLQKKIKGLEKQKKRLLESVTYSANALGSDLARQVLEDIKKLEREYET